MGLLGGSSGGILSGLTGASGTGGVGTLVTGPIQARLTAFKAASASPISSRVQAALAASPIGARLQGLTAGLGTGTSTTSTQAMRHAASIQPHVNSGRAPPATAPNKNLLSYL